MKINNFSKQYLEIIATKFNGLNLTRIVDEEEFYIKQVLDSIQPFQNSKTFKKIKDKIHSLVDIGFGGGFPILPLSIEYNDLNFIGIEARKKKVDAVSGIAKDLGVRNARFFHERVENIYFDEKCLLTFKAVGTIENSLKLINPGEKLYVAFYKGQNFYKNEENYNNIPGWKVLEEVKVHLDNLGERYLILLENTTVPRGTFRIKNLVKLSQLN